MVGQGRKRVQSTRLLSPRRFLSLRDPQLEASDLSKALKGGPATAAYLDGQPAISGRMGEADSTQPTRNGPCHRRLGFGLDPGLISLADGPSGFYTKSVSVSLSILRTGSSSVRMGSLP